MPGGTDRGSRLAHVPSLDGLRGVAVAAVLCFHGELGFAGGGFLGVSTFFTLSGFLITSLLLLEWEGTGRIAFARFWARRARRLLPAALVALCGIAAYGALVAAGHQADRIGGDGLSALFYVANWRFVWGDQSYAALFSAPSPVQHFWSLAIEEQFYLVFPLFAAALLPRVRTRGHFRVALILLAVISAGLAFVLWSPGHDPSRVYYGTDSRAVELLIGAILATLLAGRAEFGSVTQRRISIVAGFGAGAILLALWGTTHQTDTWLYRGGLPLHAVLTAVVIAGAMQPGSLARALSWRPLRALGLVSYGAYLYHWPIFLWLTESRVGVGGLRLFGVRVTVTFVAAAASYRWLEMPIRKGRWITGRRLRLLAPAAIAAVAALLLAIPAGGVGPDVVLSAVRTPGAELHRLQHGNPSPGAPSPIRRIMVVGDSVAMTLGRGIERWGPPRGVEVLNGARLWCPIARGGKLAASFGRSTAPCDDWPHYWGQLEADFRPDVVVVLTTMWDLSARQRDEWGPDYLQMGEPRFDAFLQQEWATAVHVLGSSGARVVWLNPACSQTPSGNRELRYSHDHFVSAAVAAGATEIDLDRLLCPKGQFVNSFAGLDNIRPDGLHFSDAGADLTARWLGPQLSSLGPRSPAARPPTLRKD